MRRTSIFLIALVGFGSQAFADEWDKTLFIPATNGESAKIVDPETGRAYRVLDGLMGQRPQNCPSNTFWATAIGGVPVGSTPIERIINCDDGKEYALTKAYVSGFVDAYALVPAAKDPKPGTTDEPGPSESQPRNVLVPQPKANP